MADDALAPDEGGEPASGDPSGIDEPHDILAAEEFALPVPAPGAESPTDPSGIEEPHDVLAAEEFAMPAVAPSAFPGDPTGIDEPHDVLAAEDFALPAGGRLERARPSPAPRAGARRVAPVALAATALLAAVAWLLRRRR